MSHSKDLPLSILITSMTKDATRNHRDLSLTDGLALEIDKPMSESDPDEGIPVVQGSCKR